MEEIRYNKIALILIALIAVFILVYPPFVLSIYVPARGTLLLFFAIIFFSILIILKRNYLLYYLVPFLLFFLFEYLYWIRVGADFIESLYCLMYFCLALALFWSVRRMQSLKILLKNFYLAIVVLFSISAIISFLAFNLELIPYELKPVGEGLDVYMYYHNYLFGYINVKTFESGEIGRVCGYLLEPSYQAWFLSTNFFLVTKFVKNKKYLRIVQVVVLLGALSAFSTMSWLVLAIVFASIFAFKLMSILRFKERIANIAYGVMLIIGIIGSLTFINQDKILEMLGPSSADDRTDRASISFLYLATASPTELALGRGPGFIGKNSERGESNPIVKSLVENGLISTIFVLVFIVYCTYRSKYYMIANLLWLNSVVILFTPLFIINVLVCKWMDERIE